MPYIGVTPQFGVRRKHTYTATAGQTSFSGAGSEGVTLSYADSNFVDVYQNGIKLGDADYTSTSGTAIVLAQGASVDDLVEIIVFDAFSAADTVSKADGGTFDGAVTLAGGVSGNTTFSGEIITSTSGTSNLRIGENAGDAIASGGDYNTVVGDEAGTEITTGDQNTFVGYASGDAKTTGSQNTAVGYGALGSDTTGSRATAVGRNALTTQNLTAELNSYNTAFGWSAGEAITTGFRNTLIGANAGDAITTGDKNTILGRYNGNENSLDIRTSDNNIVISDGDGNPLAYYKVGWFINGSITNDIAVRLQNKSSTNPYGVAIQHTANANNNGSQYFLVCADTSAGRFYVYNNGDVRNSTGSYAALSDVKLKEQITDASSQWDDIKALTIRKYKMKEDVSTKGDSDDLWRLGVVAQELETAGMNGLVTEDNDTEIDEDGSINELGTTTKSVKYSILYMKAVKALQEAMARIETLEAKVTALENAE